MIDQTRKSHFYVNQILFFDNNRICWSWELEADGTYSVRSLRKAIDANILENSTIPTTWCKAAPRKINTFVWRLLRDRLPTRDNLQKRGVNIPTIICPACNCYPESAEHLFLRCSTAKLLMAHLNLWRPALPTLDSCNDIASLINKVNNPSWSKEVRASMEVIVRSFLWSLWCNRNNICFRSSVSTTNTLDFEVKNTSFLWLKNRCRYGKDIDFENWL